MSACKYAQYCWSCGTRRATVLIEHGRGGKVLPHCSQSCSHTGKGPSLSEGISALSLVGPAIAATKPAAEEVVERLSDLLGRSAKDGDLVTMPAGLTVFHGISDGAWGFATMRAFSYFSTNVNPPIGAGIGEKDEEYGYAKFLPRLFELEVRKPLSLVLHTIGAHGEKIENTTALDIEYGTNNDGYLSTLGEEEFRFRRNPREVVELKRIYYFPLTALKERPDDDFEHDLTGVLGGTEVTFTRVPYPLIVGLVIETSTTVDRLFSYRVLRQVAELRKETENHICSKLDTAFVGAYHLVRRGMTATTFFAFDSDAVDETIKVSAQSKLQCHNHPNLRRQPLAFVVMQEEMDEDDNLTIFGGGALSTDVRADIVIISMIQMAVQRFVTVAAAGKKSQRRIGLRIPYNFVNALYNYGFDGEGTKDTAVVLLKLNPDQYYQTMEITPLRLETPPPFDAKMPATLYADIGMDSPTGKSLDCMPDAILQHALLLRSKKLVDRAEEIARQLMQESPDDYPSLWVFIARFLRNVVIADSSQQGELQWVFSYLKWWAVKAGTIPLDVQHDLTDAFAAMVIGATAPPENTPEAAVFQELATAFVETFVLAGTKAISATVAYALATGVNNWEEFMRSRLWNLFALEMRLSANTSLLQLATIISIQPRTPWPSVPLEKLYAHRDNGDIAHLVLLFKSKTVSAATLQHLLDNLAPQRPENLSLAATYWANSENTDLDKAKAWAVKFNVAEYISIETIAGRSDLLQIVFSLATEQQLLGWKRFGHITASSCFTALLSRIPDPSAAIDPITYEEAIAEGVKEQDLAQLPSIPALVSGQRPRFQRTVIRLYKECFGPTSVGVSRPGKRQGTAPGEGAATIEDPRGRKFALVTPQALVSPTTQ